MLPKGAPKKSTATTAQLKRGTCDVLCVVEELAVSKSGSMVLGMGGLVDRIPHTARDDQVVRVARVQAAVHNYVLPLETSMDVNKSGRLHQQFKTVKGESIFKLTVLDATNEPTDDQKWLYIAPDCNGVEVGHVFLGILPHPGAGGIADSARDVQHKARFVERLYDRDVGDNATIYLQKGHAEASKLTSGDDLAAELKEIGWYSCASKAGKKLKQQHETRPIRLLTIYGQLVAEAERHPAAAI